MIQICEFDEKRDLCETVGGLDVDLNLAITAGVIPNSGTAPEYNQISEIERIAGRIHDAFDVVDAQRYLSTVVKSGTVSNKDSGVKTEDGALS